MGSFLDAVMPGADSIIDAGMDIWKQDKAEDMQQHSMNFNAAEAAANRQFQKEMRRTQYQTAVHDMQKAGLNPMLAYHQGGSGTPPGAMASSSAGSVPNAHQSRLTANMQTAAQTSLIDAQRKNIEADTALKEADANERRERTPTHAVNIEQTRQHIAESIKRMEKIDQEIRTGIASAANLEQHTRNLQETIPQIRAATTQLAALANLNQAQAVERLTASGLNEAHAKETYQRIKQDLPDLQRKLLDLDRVIQEMSLPGHANQQTIKDSATGIIGDILRHLLPLGGIVGAIPLARNKTVIQKSEPRITVKPY